MPDIHIENTIDDINNGYDRQLEKAKQVIIEMQKNRTHIKK